MLSSHFCCDVKRIIIPLSLFPYKLRNFVQNDQLSIKTGRRTSENWTSWRALLSQWLASSCGLWRQGGSAQAVNSSYWDKTIDEVLIVDKRPRLCNALSLFASAADRFHFVGLSRPIGRWRERSINTASHKTHDDGSMRMLRADIWTRGFTASSHQSELLYTASWTQLNAHWWLLPADERITGSHVLICSLNQ